MGMLTVDDVGQACPAPRSSEASRGAFAKRPYSRPRDLFARLSAMKTVLEEIEEHIARVGTHPVYGYVHCLRVFAWLRS